MPHHQQQYSQSRDYWSALGPGSMNLPMWDAIRNDGTTALTSGASGGMKRSHDATAQVGELFQDMKKRRVNPSYDSRTCLVLCYITNHH